MDDAQSITKIVEDVLTKKSINDPEILAEVENIIRDQLQGCQLYITKSPSKIPERVQKIREAYRSALRTICHEYKCSEAYLRQCVRNKPATQQLADNLDLFKD